MTMAGTGLDPQTLQMLQMMTQQRGVGPANAQAPGGGGASVAAPGMGTGLAQGAGNVNNQLFLAMALRKLLAQRGMAGAQAPNPYAAGPPASMAGSGMAPVEE